MYKRYVNEKKRPQNIWQIIFYMSLKFNFLLRLYRLKAFYNEKYSILYTIQTRGVKFKRISECILRKPSSTRKCIIHSKKLWKFFFHAHVDQSLLNVCTKLFGKITGRRRLHICKWAFLQFPSLTLWFRITLPIIMQIVKDKNKIRWN